jgi:hypothetical protein
MATASVVPEGDMILKEFCRRAIIKVNNYFLTKN